MTEIAEKWHERKVQAGTYKRASLTHWKNHVDNFISAELGSLKVSQLDIEAIEKAAAAWAERASPKTSNAIMTTLAAILDLAKRYKLIRENPAHSAERLKLAVEDEDSGEVTPDKVYNKGELKKLFEATEPGSRDRLLVMVPALLGLRIGEVLGLAWPAIDFNAMKLHVIWALGDSDKGQEPSLQSPKTKHSRRSLDLPQELAHELKLWKLRCPTSEHDLVFPNQIGKPWSRKMAGKTLDKVIEAAELQKRLTLHGLRHTFASLLLADGIPAPEVAHHLGH